MCIYLIRSFVCFKGDPSLGIFYFPSCYFRVCFTSKINRSTKFSNHSVPDNHCNAVELYIISYFIFVDNLDVNYNTIHWILTIDIYYKLIKTLSDQCNYLRNN